MFSDDFKGSYLRAFFVFVLLSNNSDASIDAHLLVKKTAFLIKNSLLA